VVANSLNNLARILIDRGRLAEAEGSLREAIAINREAYGDVHFVVGQNLGNLLSLQLRTGALAEAEEAGREALAIHRATLDEENPWVALDLHNLGKVLDLQGRLDEALSTLEEALAVSRAAQGDEHPETAEILFTLGRVHQARGELDRAEQLFRRYLDLRTETATGQTTAKGLTHLAEVLLAQGRREDARTLAAEAVEAARLLPPAQRWRLAVASSVEIEAAATPVIVPDAERRLLADLSTLLASDSADLRHDREALLRIARVYERWGRPQDAARYVDRARDGGSD
jgi:tetratricopeptide (TPR) repeat protein